MGYHGQSKAALDQLERRNATRRVEAELEKRCAETMAAYPRAGSAGAREAGAGLAFWARLEAGCPDGRGGCAKRLMKLLMVSAKPTRERDLKRLVACSEIGIEAARAYACRARNEAERDAAWREVRDGAGARLRAAVGSRSRTYFGVLGGTLTIFATMSVSADVQAACAGGAASLAVAAIWGSEKLADLGGRWAEARLEKAAA